MTTRNPAPLRGIILVALVLIVPRVCHAENYQGLAFVLLFLFVVNVCAPVLMGVFAVILAVMSRGDKPPTARKRAFAKFGRGMAIFMAIPSILAVYGSGMLFFKRGMTGKENLIGVVLVLLPIAATVLLFFVSQRLLNRERT